MTPSRDRRPLPRTSWTPPRYHMLAGGPCVC